MPGPRVTLRTGRSRSTIVFSRYSSVPGPTRATTVGAVSPTIVRSVGLASPDARGGEDGRGARAGWIVLAARQLCDAPQHALVDLPHPHRVDRDVAIGGHLQPVLDLQRAVLVAAVGEQHDRLACPRRIAHVAAGVVERVVEGRVAARHRDVREGLTQVLRPRRARLHQPRLVVEGEHSRFGPRSQLPQDPERKLARPLQAGLPDAARGIEGHGHDGGILGKEKGGDRAGEAEKGEGRRQQAHGVGPCTTAGYEGQRACWGRCGWQATMVGRPMLRQPPFRNNARLVLLATAGALVAFLAVQLLLRKSRDFAPDFLASVLLYGLTVLNLTLLLVLGFVLGRNLVRVLMERRRRVLGARFRMRLLLVFLLMAIAPSALLIAVGSDLIQQAIDRWFSVDVERILSSSQALGTALKESVADRSRVHARALARELAARGSLTPEKRASLRRLVEARARELRIDMVDVFVPEGELLAVMDPRLPPASDPGPSGETLADSALAGKEAETIVPSPLGDLVRVGVPVRDASGTVQGAVVVSTLLPGGVAAEAREVQERYTKFRKTEAVKEPIKALYVSIYLLAALLILFGAVWLSLYLARRITTPLRLVAEGAERIASG